MNLKEFAKPYPWQGATLWFLPFRRLDVDIAVRGLNDIEPEIEYVNAKTGERVTEEPEALAQKRENAQKLNSKLPVKSDWSTVRLWDIAHDTFYLCLPSIVAIDFPDFDESTPTELRVFAAYWNDPGKTVAERWSTFKAIIGTATFNALWTGYTETRDNLAPAKPELGAAEPADPKEEPNGAPPEASTTAS